LLLAAEEKGQGVIKYIVIIILVLLCCVITGYAGVPTGAKEAHLYIKADAQNVTVRNLWIFRREFGHIDKKQKWIAELSLPKNAAIVDPGKMKRLGQKDIWQVSLDPDLSIGSVRFVYSIPNESAAADMNVPLPENTAKIFIYIDKDLKNLGIKTKQLKLNKFLTEKSNFAAVYTKKSQDTKNIMIRFVNLPVNAFSFWQKFCLASLGLMVMASLFTICKYKKKQAKDWLSNVFGIRRFWG